MKKLIKTSLITALLACSFNPLYASGSHDHGGHSHAQKEVTKEYAQNVAIKEVKNLVKNNKIDNSWSNKTVANAEKKKFEHDFEWVFSFENKDIKETAKQTLYVFVTLYGESNGANYSGK
jgi:hypothetical protein